MKLFNYIIPTKQEKGLKALVISDIHYYSNKDNYKLNNIIKELLSNKYDAIYLIGYIIDATNVLDVVETKDNLLNFLRILASHLPTYIAFGSHDLVYYLNNENLIWSDDNRFLELVLEMSLKLDNLYIKINKPLELPNNDTVTIINPNFDYARRTLLKDKTEVITETILNFSFLNNNDSSITNTLLCHYPEVIFALYKSGLLDYIDLSIAGHTHNGITQLKVFPLENILNLIGQENRGLITPTRSLSLKDTKYLRGLIDFNSKSSLIINPSITTFAPITGSLNRLDKLFYQGASVINYVKEDEYHDKIKNLHR